MNKKIDMNKKILIGIGIGVIVVVAAVAYLVIPMPVSEGYTVLTTVTNQFFVGRVYRTPLSKFIELREPFLLQTITDPETNAPTPQLIDLSIESYWMPKSIFIHVDNIVSKGVIDPESLIATKIKEYNVTK